MNMTNPVRYLLIMLCLLLTDCHESPSQSPPLRVGVNPWVGYDPLVLAREQGLVDGNRVLIVDLMSNTESIRALRNGLLDAAALTLDEALRLADEDVAVKVVALLDTSNGADALMVRPGLFSLADLKGKRIALEKTALGALMLDGVLQKAGLQQSDVETLHVEAAQHAEVLTQGNVDAVITFEPMKSQLLAKGFHSLFDSSQMPGEIVDTLVVQAAIEPSRIAYLLQTWERGRQQLQANPKKAADLLAPSLELSSQAYLATLQGLHLIPLKDSAEMLKSTKAGLIHDANKLVIILRRLGLLQHAPDWNALLDNRAAMMALEQQP